VTFINCQFADPISYDSSTFIAFDSNFEKFDAYGDSTAFIYDSDFSSFASLQSHDDSYIWIENTILGGVDIDVFDGSEIWIDGQLYQNNDNDWLNEWIVVLKWKM